MVKPRRILRREYPHYDPNNNLIGFLNLPEHSDLRKQIREARVSGYYLMYNGIKIHIDKYGNIPLPVNDFNYNEIK